MTDTNELLRCDATLAILKTFGFADLQCKSLHPHVFVGPKLKSLIVQARSAFRAFAPGITNQSRKAAYGQKGKENEEYKVTGNDHGRSNGSKFS